MLTNADVSAVLGPAAGLGATASILGTNADGSRGLIAVTTGTGALAAGRLASVVLAVPLVADMDTYVQAVLGGLNGGVFGTMDLLLTPYSPPPAGGGYVGVVDLDAQGRVFRFGIGSAGALLPSTTYRFGWRLMA